MHPLDFVNKWTGVTLTERSASQQHFLDLCAVLDQPTPADLDKDGSRYTFEKGLATSTGGQGWADVWYRGHFAWEYKGPHKDLDKAYGQLLRYKDWLENPPLLVVSDLDKIIIRTNFTNTTQVKHEISLADFATSESQATLRQLFTEPMAFRPSNTPEAVTMAAAVRFGDLARSAQSRGHDPHAVAHFLMQMLFCLFAEDIGLLPNRVFSRLLAFGRQNPAALRDEIQGLLETMQEGGFVAWETIPHVNGGLFREVRALELTPAEIDELAAAAELDWSQVEPAIFGTLFEHSLDPAQRSPHGIYYTGRADILRVVEPVVMMPLRRRWDTVRAELETLVARRDATKSASARTQAQNRIGGTVQRFTDELAAVTILDPACGSGNFLYVSLNQLLNLEKEALAWGATEGGLPMGIPKVGPRQVTGLEVNAYAQELAQVVIWIGYLQWMIGNGFGWREPVLEDLRTIRLQDALLDVAPGPVPGDRGIERTIWPEAHYIIGNPPFLGGNRIRQELGDEYVDTLFRVYAGSVPQFADLCCYFFEQGREAIAGDRAERAGLLATNSIRGGANREVLKRIKETGDIFMAWSDEPWILDGAAVRISIVGFDDGDEESKSLDGLSVTTINSDLTGGVDITTATPLIENRDISFMGPSPKAPFDVSESVAEKMLHAPVNVNDRPNSDVVRPVVSAVDIMRNDRYKWTIDFALMPLEEASQYEMPFEYVKEYVLPVRESGRRADFRGAWWQYARPRSEMRSALEGLSRQLITPAVAKHRAFVWRTMEYLCNQGTLVFAREDDYFFGVLHSRAHEIWSLRMGTSLEDRPRYTPTTTFETFPLPWPPGQEPVDDPRVEAIATAAKSLDELREHWLNPPDASTAELKKRTLTNLYNARPTWLANAHATLDRAVWDAYGWPGEEVPAEVAEDVILSRLLALNGERSAL